MKKEAFGAIDLLITLLVMTAIFMIGMKTFKPVIQINGDSGLKSVKEQVDEQVSEIEKMRQKSIEFENELLLNE